MNLSRYTDLDDTLLRRMDGRVKTCVLLAAVIVVASVTQWQLACGMWGLAMLFIFAFRYNPRDLLLRLLMPLGIAWLVFLSVLFTYGSSPLFHVPLGFLTLTAWKEGALRGVLLCGRMMAAVTLALLLALSTPMIEILETLRLCKAPGTIVDIADMMYRYIFLLQETANTMGCAQLSRAGDRAGWTHRVAGAGRIAACVLSQSLDRSTRIYEAMLARGYDERSTGLTYFLHPIPLRDKLTGGACFLVLLLVAIANLCWK